MEILPDVTGSGKSKMAVYKLVLSIYRLVDKIERRFQQKTLYFRWRITQEKNGDDLNQTGIWKIQYGGLQTGNTYISASR